MRDVGRLAERLTQLGLRARRSGVQKMRHGYSAGVRYGAGPYDYVRSEDPASLAAAALIEQAAWDEKNYGDLAVYGDFIDRARTFLAFDRQECVGVARLFNGQAAPPPFLSEMPYADPAVLSLLEADLMAGRIEELGTSAVVPRARGTGINARLWRMAVRDSLARRVTKLAIIMEPERVGRLNRFHGFGFQQVSDVVAYQGGDCAAHVVDLLVFRAGMRKARPLTYWWYFKLPTGWPLRPAQNRRGAERIRDV